MHLLHRFPAGPAPTLTVCRVGLRVRVRRVYRAAPSAAPKEDAEEEEDADAAEINNAVGDAALACMSFRCARELASCQAAHTTALSVWREGQVAAACWRADGLLTCRGPFHVPAVQTLEIVTKMVREGAITAEAAKRHAHVLKSVKVLDLSKKNWLVPRVPSPTSRAPQPCATLTLPDSRQPPPLWSCRSARRATPSGFC